VKKSENDCCKIPQIVPYFRFWTTATLTLPVIQSAITQLDLTLPVIQSAITQLDLTLPVIQSAITQLTLMPKHNVFRRNRKIMKSDY
jgi:hypothetical protein